MSSTQIHLEIATDSVSVRLNPPPRQRFYALAFFVLLAFLLALVVLIAPGRGGTHSIWHDLSTPSVGAVGFIALPVLFLGFPLLLMVLAKRHVMLAYPSEETVQVDRMTLRFSKVRWLDVHNCHWNVCSFSLNDVREIRYGALASLQMHTIYGLRFEAGGKTYRVLPELKASDAEKILLTLKTLGADVPDDPVIPARIRENVMAG